SDDADPLIHGAHDRGDGRQFPELSGAGGRTVVTPRRYRDHVSARPRRLPRWLVVRPPGRGAARAGTPRPRGDPQRPRPARVPPSRGPITLDGHVADAV